jgi:hypothetical protein
LKPNEFVPFGTKKSGIFLLFKQWLAHVAKERIDQLQDPELSIEQAMTDYRNQQRHCGSSPQ